MGYRISYIPSTGLYYDLIIFEITTHLLLLISTITETLLLNSWVCFMVNGMVVVMALNLAVRATRVVFVPTEVDILPIE